MFYELQCPFSKIMATQHMKDIQIRFDSEYDFTFHLTSCVIHQQAFTVQCGASLTELVLGREAMVRYVDACFQHRNLFTNKAMIDSDATKSDIDRLFASIAETANIFDLDFTKEKCLTNLHNWDMADQPADTNVKYAYGQSVWCAPLDVIDNKLTTDRESAWGPNE